MAMSSAAAWSSARNWRSVAFRAASGMLLMSPMSMHVGWDSRNRVVAARCRRCALPNVPTPVDCACLVIIGLLLAELIPLNEALEEGHGHDVGAGHPVNEFPSSTAA